jgi:hypothetical protein
MLAFISTELDTLVDEFACIFYETMQQQDCPYLGGFNGPYAICEV